MDTLEASPIFAPLGQEEIRALRSIAQERSFSPAQEIFKEGDAGDGLTVRRCNDGADPLRVGVHGADLCGLFDVPPDQATVVAAGNERRTGQDEAVGAAEGRRCAPPAPP